MANGHSVHPRSHRKKLRRSWVVVAVSMAALLSGLVPGTASAEDYKLGPLDKLRLKIYEWRASRDEVFEWKALNDEYIVGADGNIALPFVGSLKAEGFSTTDLGNVIGDSLRTQMGLGRNPKVAVEVVQFRPFYIVGGVQKPGEYPYRPHLTVLQALGIAGGLQTREEGVNRLEREVIISEGELSTLELTTVNLLARRARLQAELNEADTVEMPPELTSRDGAGTTRHMLDQEKLIFQARKESLLTQVRALSELRDFLEKEVGSLENQIGLYDTQLALVQKELDGVSTLVDKGLAAQPRELALNRLLAEIQGDRLTTETGLFRARQEISRTEIAILELKNQHRNEVTLSLRETEMQLDETARKSDTALRLLHESEVTAPRLLALRATKAKPVYSIVRASGATLQELPAEETTLVLPGDTVRIEIPITDPTSIRIGSEPVAPRTGPLATGTPSAASSTVVSN